MASRDPLTANREKFRSQPLGRNNRFPVEKDSYHYLIDFPIDPVEFGFFCDESGSCRTFKGLGAFNEYFDALVRNQGASSLPDVWDGYYRITLAQFETQDDPEKLKRKFDLFRPSSVNTEVPEALFRSSKLDVNRTPTYRLGSEFRNEPIALYVTASCDLVFEPLIAQIKKQIAHTKWVETARSDLHMNIRLYSRNDEMADKSEWTWNRVHKLGIPEKVILSPIFFSRSTLEIILSRGDCKKLYENGRSSKWWSGVTELNNQCSGCDTGLERNEKWKGVCRKCRKYERIKPIWSHLFSVTVQADPKTTTIHKNEDNNEGLNKIEQDEIKSNGFEKQNRFNLEFVSKLELWKKKNLVDDTLVVALSRDFPTLIAETLLKNFCPDLFFIQRSTKDENSTNETPQILIDGRSYIYHYLVKQAGLYYNSAKLELVALIDTSDLGISLMNEVSGKPAQVDTTFYSPEYSVLFRRKYTEQEKNQIATKYDHLPAYSFIAMSYQALASCREDSKKEVNEFFWKYVSQIQRKIRPTSTSLFPIVLAIHGDTGIGTKDHELPKTWACCSNVTENQEKATNEDCLCYRDSDTYPKMFMGGLQYFDPHSKQNYTKKQWKQLKALCNQPQTDLTRTTNQQFGMAFVGFKR